MNKLVSVIIPTYNREKTLARAIESVLNQTYKNFEIIIVDDNSTDNSSKIINNYLVQFSNIKYVKHDKNKGGSAARNTGVREADGKYISFLDSDDEWIKNKLELDVNTIIKEKADMVYSNMYVIDVETGKCTTHKHLEYKNIYLGLLSKNIIGGTSLITVKKDIFELVNGFDESLPSCQDWDFYIKVACNHNIVKIDEFLLKYYVHGDSISGNIDNAILGSEIMIKKIKNILENSKEYKSKQKEILSNQYITIAMIYRRFNKYEKTKECYKMAFKENKKNITAIKNILAMILGKEIYYKLVKN